VSWPAGGAREPGTPAPAGDGGPSPWTPEYSRLFPSARPAEPEPPPEPRRRRLLPVLLFLATCGSTFLVGGPVYAAALLTILLAHELGHFFQAVRYGVPASLPYFIPMPLTPIGTMGAVIAMRPHSANNRALFDLAITGPIAGLIPALAFSFAGLRMSTVAPVADQAAFLRLGEPLVFKWLSHLVFGTLPPGQEVTLHPLAYAGWVGIFITALNLLPIGQLDGGHILYSLLPGHARRISVALLLAATVGVAVGGYWEWSLMLLLLILIGTRHPPTAGWVPLGRTRIVLGWLMILFFFIGFTPQPFDLSSLQEVP